jgi:hypothetical protein
VSQCSESPEPTAGIDRQIRDRALKLCRVDEPKVIGPRRVVLQISSEDRGRKPRLCVIEESLLLYRFNCEATAANLVLFLSLRESGPDGFVASLPLLMVPNDKPSRPSVFVSRTNEALTEVANSTACFVTVTPPTFTVSVPTIPLAPLPSP